jgi:hypothetical protein
MSNTLNDVRFQLKNKSQQVARRMAQSGQTDLRRTAPIDTGALSRATGITYTQSRNTVKWDIVVDVPYAEAQAYGARPHVIRPVRASALRFYWPKAGKVVYFKQVNHPGNQPNKWWDNWLREAPRRLQHIWDRS